MLQLSSLRLCIVLCVLGNLASSAQLCGYTFCFEKVGLKHKQIVLQWLEEPHVQEFWDNSTEHKDDIKIFANNETTTNRSYFNGAFTYWIGSIDGEPFSFILTSEVVNSPNLYELHRQYISKTGMTISLDYCIGNPKYIGQGLGATTLQAFLKFFCNEVESNTKTFFIDPEITNVRAQHVYKNAGFNSVGTFMLNDVYFKDIEAVLMVHHIEH